MARLGFEAICVSRGSLRHYNNGAGWTRTIGMRSCDLVAGLPVIPRFGLSKHCRNDILIAALLRQPIVPMTHHQGVADGYHLLDEMASFVNSLGEVAWRDMKSISRSLYLQRRDDAILSVNMLSTRVSVPVPPEITRIRAIPPRIGDSAKERLFWRTVGESRRWNLVSSDETIAVQRGATIEIALGPIGATRTAIHRAGKPRLAPAARRLLTEVRDRALPSIHRIARRRHPSRLA
jgi:hypothetical protein